MNHFFAGQSTVETIKANYKKLAMQYHPDRGGDTATMQELNSQYQKALQACHGQTVVGNDDIEHTYYYNAKREQEIVDFLDKLIRSHVLSANIECWLIGTWVWITGDTKPVKDTLKGLGCRWHSKRICWYWHNAETRTHYNEKVSLEGIAAAYGATLVPHADKESLLAA